ncbi:MAG: Jag N-terminal domain-containing protein, partial [bacterium]|nr:Jag N-terminal domain-containing protein [bacterium]
MEKTAKTVEEAIELALAELGISLEQAEVVVMEEPSKGLFGIIGGRAARVKVTKKASDAHMVRFLDELIRRMGATEVACVVTIDDEETLAIDITADNSGVLIGKRGQTLDAIGQIASLAFHQLEKRARRMVVDINGYRARRIESLENLALRIAEN